MRVIREKQERRMPDDESPVNSSVKIESKSARPCNPALETGSA
jgi:hypothetical protein